MDSRGYVMALEEAEARLKAVTEQLTRERNDARTEAELMKQAGRVLEQQRDEARAELDAERARLITRVQALVGLLREVEWTASDNNEDAICPVCYGQRDARMDWGRPLPQGHAPDCRLKAALEGRDE